MIIISLSFKSISLPARNIAIKRASRVASTALIMTYVLKNISFCSTFSDSCNNKGLSLIDPENNYNISDYVGAFQTTELKCTNAVNAELYAHDSFYLVSVFGAWIIFEKDIKAQVCDDDTNIDIKKQDWTRSTFNVEVNCAV